MRFPHVLRSVVGIAGSALLATACASTGAVPRPFPAPLPQQHVPNPADASGTPPSVEGLAGQPLADVALSFRGTPYRNGGADPTGFDCSGFTQYVFGRFGVALPRGVREQFSEGQAILQGALTPGDLVFFSTTGPGATHVGIAIGGDAFVHAPSSRGVVRVEHVNASYWASRYLGARRITHS